MIYILRGTSCSGKDVLASRTFPDHTVLSSDAFRLMLFDDVSCQSGNELVFGMLTDILEKRVAAGVAYTVINATSLKFKDVEKYVDVANRYGQRVTVISLDPPSMFELHRRAEYRGYDGGLKTPATVLERHYNTYFAAMPRFLEYAASNPMFKFLRFDQTYELVTADV